MAELRLNQELANHSLAQVSISVIPLSQYSADVFRLQNKDCSAIDLAA